MRNLSTEFKEQQNSGNRNYLKYADFTFTDGSTLSITDKDLWSNGFKFEDAVSQSGSFDIGAAIVNKLTLQINNFSGKYTITSGTERESFAILGLNYLLVLKESVSAP